MTIIFFKSPESSLFTLSSKSSLYCSFMILATSLSSSWEGRKRLMMRFFSRVPSPERESINKRREIRFQDFTFHGLVDASCVPCSWSREATDQSVLESSRSLTLDDLDERSSLLALLLVLFIETEKMLARSGVANLNDSL